MLINYGTINRLATDLDKRVQITELLGSNIANVDTPGFKAMEFTELLENSMGDLELKTSSIRHMSLGSSSEGLMIQQSESAARPDGNNVNVDEEMMKLTKNNIRYNVGVQLISKKLSGLKEAIRSGGK